MFTTLLLFFTVQVSGQVSDISINKVLFVDEFDNKKLDGWYISHVNVRNGKLILGNNGDLQIDVRKSETWMDYTTILRLRFLETQPGCTFHIFIRKGLGRFNVWTNQQFTFSPHEGEIQVYTVRPKKQPREKPKIPASARYNFVKKKWYRFTIEIIDNRFTLFIDRQEIFSFKDEGTLAGTVGILTGHTNTIRMEIDFIRVVQPMMTIPTTWAAVKNRRLKER